MRLLHTAVGDIHDSDILMLIDELEQVSSVSSRNFVSSQLLLFLTQCLYPKGAEKRIPLNTALAAFTPTLEFRVGKLPDSPLRNLCWELANLSGKALELYNGNKVCVLLNKTIPKFPKPKKSTVKQRRWDAVIQQRRASR